MVRNILAVRQKNSVSLNTARVVVRGCAMNDRKVFDKLEEAREKYAER